MPEGVTDPNYRPPPGRLGNLTVTQLHTLEKLKKELKEEGAFVEERMTDTMLLRFLRARKFDLIKTKEMLLAAEQWRKDFGVEDIVKNFDFKEKAEVDKILSAILSQERHRWPPGLHRTSREARRRGALCCDHPRPPTPTTRVGI